MPEQLAILAACSDVNAVVQALLKGAPSVLGDHFSGLYFYGSLATHQPESLTFVEDSS
jgi:hypothetical protein